MEPLSIVCWKWNPLLGVISTKRITKFTHVDVNILFSMLQKHLHIPFQLICVTDDPKGIREEVKIVPLWDEFRDKGGCFVRLGAFRKDIASLFGPRFVSMDLDCVIVGDITNLFSRTEDFIIWGNHGGRTQYCGSLWMMNSGCRPQVYESFNPDVYKIEHGKYQKGTDQLHISNTLSDEVVWTKEDGIHAYRNMRNRDLPANAKIIFFNGINHPKDAAMQSYYPWLKKHYVNADKSEKPPVNVVCFYWVGDKGSGWESLSLAEKYINRLYSSVKRNLTIPFKFTCFMQDKINIPNLDPEINVQYFTAPVWKGRLPKLYAFSKEADLQGRVVIVDLDLLITGNLDAMFSYNGRFMTRSEPMVENVAGGDIVFFEANTFKFWELFKKDTRNIINTTHGNERFFYRQSFGKNMDFLQNLYPESFLSYKCHIRRNINITSKTRLISCHGHPKPHELVDTVPWVKEYWR
jgi:hypothetical protein